MKTYADPDKQASHFSQSTYAMILRAEDRRRNILENAVYFCLMLSVVAALVPMAGPLRWAMTKASAPKPIVATATAL